MNEKGHELVITQPVIEWLIQKSFHEDFGARQVNARLYVPPYEVANPYNHTMIECDAPKAPQPIEQDVSVEVCHSGHNLEGCCALELALLTGSTPHMWGHDG